MASANVFTFDDSNFDAEVIQSDLPVLVDFTATWCGPCRMLAPHVDKVADQYKGKVKVGKLDIDAAPQTAAKYAIRSVPTLMVFKGGKRTDQHVGVTNQDRIVKLLGL